jgi:hypothetical protein
MRLVPLPSGISHRRQLVSRTDTGRFWVVDDQLLTFAPKLASGWVSIFNRTPNFELRVKYRVLRVNLDDTKGARLRCELPRRGRPRD